MSHHWKWQSCVMQISPTTQTWDGWVWGRCLQGLKSEIAEFLQMKGKYVEFLQLQDKIIVVWFCLHRGHHGPHEWTELQTTREGPFCTSDVQPRQTLQGKITPPDPPSWWSSFVGLNTWSIYISQKSVIVFRPAVFSQDFGVFNVHFFYCIVCAFIVLFNVVLVYVSCFVWNVVPLPLLDQVIEMLSQWEKPE